jgi:hypothetical protein
MVLQGSAQYWPAGTYIRCRADQPVLVEHGLYGFRILKPNCLPDMLHDPSHAESNDQPALGFILAEECR